MPEPGRRQRLPHVVTALAVAAVLVHLYGLYRPTGPPVPLWFPLADKVGHVLVFALPVGLILLARTGIGAPSARPQQPTHLLVPQVVVAFAVHGVLSEVIQHLAYRHRTGDPADVLADWLGVAVGWGAAHLLALRHRPGRGSRIATDLQLPR
jgi:hypothetical protein